MAKVSTKTCPQCGNNRLMLLYSQKKKICYECSEVIPWELEEGQKSILIKPR